MTGDLSSKRKEKKADCKERIQDNRSTHFQFGSDEEPKHTEQVQKFRRDANNLAGTILQMSTFEHRSITCLDRKKLLFCQIIATSTFPISIKKGTTLASHADVLRLVALLRCLGHGS